MSQNKQYSHADPNMIERRVFDEVNDAKRVIIVGGDLPQFNISSPISQSSMPEIKIERIEIPVIVKEIEIKEVEKIVLQTVVERIEVPTVIKETIIEKVEVPVYITKLEYVEKAPIVIKEVEYKTIQLPKILTICLAAQVVISLVTMLLKH